jgi:hypothetical protein
VRDVECLEAQGLISEAMDREPVDAAKLAEAKAHCRTCDECAAFVRAQLALKSAALPQPPADLAERVMATVRAEAAANEAEARAAAGDAAGGTTTAPTRPTAPTATLAAPRRRNHRRLPRPYAVGIAAAVMLAAVIGTGTLIVFGTRQMAPSQANVAATDGSGIKTTAQSESEARSQDYFAPAAAAGGHDGSPRVATGAVTKSATAGQSSGVSLITVNGAVYSLAGPSDTSLAGLTPIGSAHTSLDGKSALMSRTVYAGLSADQVYLTDDASHTLEFARVKRTYLGLTYQLMSGELSAYGQWPTLPSQYAAPSGSDGSPTFAYDGTDSGGVRVYRLAQGRATDGIALAPRSDSSSLLGRDPNWSWWTRAQ